MLLLLRWLPGGAQILAAAILALPGIAAASMLSLNIGDLSAPNLALRGIEFTFAGDASAELKIAEFGASEHTLHNLQLHCGRFELSTTGLSCFGGISKLLPGTELDFDYRFSGRTFHFSVRMRDAPADSFAKFLAGLDVPLPTQGRVDGSVHASGDAGGLRAFDANLKLGDIGFGDASGLHAGEKMGGNIRLEAFRESQGWRWNGELCWQRGELFWQPIYLAGVGERRLVAAGRWSDADFEVAKAEVELPGIGRLNFSGVWDRARAQLRTASLDGSNVGLSRLFADYVRPFFDGSTLARATLEGRADVGWQYRDGATESLHLALHDVGLGDEAGRFALRGVNTAFDWKPGAASDAQIAFGGGELLGMSLGGGVWDVRLHDYDFAIDRAELPLLDGRLELRDFRLNRVGGNWRWQFGASLSRVSMERFSEAVGWPRMLGTLAGRIPKVAYDGREITVDGALMFEVFDGSIVATKLRLAEPFSPAPRLQGSLVMRDLDLDLLTRTFSFGNMLGRIDADVNDLELQDWKPARFDARVASSPGRYPKKISQKAVQNISALGGAGAAAALQRGFLQAFESFGYSRIGWRCRLRNGVCAMAGVGDVGERGNEEAYAIVEGGGIPAITVMGYNRNVSWDVLIERLKRVTKGGSKPVVD